MDKSHFGEPANYLVKLPKLHSKFDGDAPVNKFRWLSIEYSLGLTAEQGDEMPAVLEREKAKPIIVYRVGVQAKPFEV